MYLLLRYVNRSTILFTVFGLIVVSIAVTASAKLWSKDLNNVGPTAPNDSVAQPANPRRTLTLLPIQLRQNGFYPREVSKPAGNFEFLLINATGMHDVELQLESEHGERVQTFNPKRGRNLRKQLHLAPGAYTLRVAEHPELECRLTITAR